MKFKFGNDAAKPDVVGERNSLLRFLVKAAGDFAPKTLRTYFLGQVLNQALLLGADTLISRALGPANRGIWFGLLTMLLLAAGILSFALPMSCYFYVGNLRIGIGRVNNACLLFISSAFPVLTITGHFLQKLAIFQQLPTPELWVVGCALLVCIEMYLLCWYGMMMGTGDVTSVIAANITSSSVLLLTIGLFAWFHRIDLSTVFFSYLASRLVLVSVFVIYCHRRHTIRFGREWNLLWRMFAFGARGQPGNLFTMGFLRTIFAYLYRFGGAIDLGIFGVAYDLSTKVGFLNNAVQFVSARSIVGAELSEAKKKTWKIMRAMLIGYGMLFLPLCGAALVCIPLFYGPKYRGAVGVFIVLSVGAFLQGTNQILGVYLNGRLGRPEINSAIAFFALVLAAAGGFWMVGRWGLYGAAATISLTFLLQLIAALVMFRWARESSQVLEAGNFAPSKISDEPA